MKKTTRKEERTRRLKVTAKQGTSNEECLAVMTKKRAMMIFGRRRIRTRLLRQRRGIGVINDSSYYHSSRSKAPRNCWKEKRRPHYEGKEDIDKVKDNPQVSFAVMAAAK